MKYDQTAERSLPDQAAAPPPRTLVNLYTQMLMLGTYPGDLGGKIGWTDAAGATYIGMARRGGTRR